MAIGLPEGFVIDDPAQPTAKSVEPARPSEPAAPPQQAADSGALPEGFVLDSGEHSFSESKPVVTKEKPGVAEGILNDFVTGYAESAAGMNRKLAALSKFIDPVIDTDYFTKNLTENSKYLTNLAKTSSEHAGGNWLLQGLGAAPNVFAEFAPVGQGVRAMAVGGAVLSALDEYGRQVIDNKDIKPGQIALEGVKGGALMGATAGVFKGLGVSLEKLGALLPKHGPSIMRKVLKELGIPEENIEPTMVRLKEYMPGGKAFEKPEVLAKTQGAEIAGMKASNEEALWQERTLGKGKQVEDTVEQIRQDTTTKINRVADDNRISLEKLAEKRKQLQEDYRIAKITFDPEKRETIEAASTTFDTAVKKAEAELHDATGQHFSGLWNTLQTYKKGIDDTVDSYLDRFYKTSSDGVSLSKVGNNVAEALNTSRVFSATYKDGVLQVAPAKGLTGKTLTESARGIESWLNSFLTAGKDNTKLTLQNLRFNHGDMDRMVASMFEKGGVNADVGAAVKLVKSKLDPVKYLDDVSPEASAFFSGLKQDLKKYGESKDLMESWEALLFKNEKGIVVPDTKHLMGALESPTGKAFLSDIARLEAKSPPGLSVLKEAREFKKTFDTIKSSQESMLTRVKAGLEKSAKDRDIVFRQEIKTLTEQQAKLGDVPARRAIREQIRTLQTESRKEINGVREAFEMASRDHSKKLAKGIEAREAQHAKDMVDAKTADILRSWRPKQGMTRVLQSIGAYGSIGGAVTAAATGTLVGAAPVLAGQAALAYAMSPIALSRAFEWGMRNKGTIKAVSGAVEKTGKYVSESKSSKLLQQLLYNSTNR